jgi:hypothetical protein
MLLVILFEFSLNFNFLEIFKKKISTHQISWKSIQWHPSCTTQTDMTKLTVPLRNFAPDHTMKAYRTSRSTDPHILNLGDRWRWEVTTPQWTLYSPPPEIPPYQLQSQLSGPQSGSGRFRDETNTFPSPVLEPRIVQALLQSLYWLHNSGSTHSVIKQTTSNK